MEICSCPFRVSKKNILLFSLTEFYFVATYYSIGGGSWYVNDKNQKMFLIESVCWIIHINPFLFVGSHLYVSAEGTFYVSQDTRTLGTLKSGVAFGELALLYNCKRTASVRGTEEKLVFFY